MDKKKCSTCKKRKPLSEFNKHKGKKDGLKYSCNICEKKYREQHYNKNKSRYIERSTKRKDALKRRVYNYLETKCCVDCGESDPIVLDFDHRDNEIKLYTISNMPTKIGSWSKIEVEISKCDIRCANCHRKKTAKQLGHYKFLTR